MVEPRRYLPCQSVAFLTALAAGLATAMPMTNPSLSGADNASDAACPTACDMVRDAQVSPSSCCLPNALSSWPQIQARIANSPVAIFLDYDGTLSPHVPEPGKATLSDAMRSVLGRLSRLYMVSIITGRPMATIRRFLSGTGPLFYAASHGLDITFDSTDRERIVIASDYVPYLKAAYQELHAKLGRIDGCILEDNDLSVSVHYRNVQSLADRQTIQDAVQATLSAYPDHIRLIGGKKVWELRPAMDWDKGKAVEHILEHKFPDPGTVAVYLGDDTTDEDAFVVVRRLGGVTVLVDQQKKATAAEFVVPDPGAVFEFLTRLVDRVQAPPPN